MLLVASSKTSLLTLSFDPQAIKKLIGIKNLKKFFIFFWIGTSKSNSKRRIHEINIVVCG
jgi:hypothetical protein